MLAYLLIAPQQNSSYATPQNLTILVSLNISDPNVTTKIFTLDDDPFRTLPPKDPPALKWGLPPLFVVTIFTILLITLRLFSSPLSSPQSLPHKHPPSASNGTDEGERLPPSSPRQVPMLKELQKHFFTLLFPVIIFSFYKTLTYPISSPPPKAIIYKNETEEVATEDISAELASLLLSDPEQPKFMSGDCKW